MNTGELPLFDEQEELAELDAEQRESWDLCWDWSGPKVGGLCSFQNPIADDINGVSCYVAGAPAIVISIDGPIFTVEHVGAVPETMATEGQVLTGRLFKLRAAEIWPYINGELIEDPAQLSTEIITTP